MSDFKPFCLFSIDYSKKPFSFAFVLSSSFISDFDTYIKRFKQEHFISGFPSTFTFALFEYKNQSWFLRCMYYLNRLFFERVFYPTDYKAFIDDTFLHDSKYDFVTLKLSLQDLVS